MKKKIPLSRPLASPTVNNVSITADYTLSDGSQIFLISEVLFVSETIVSELHQVKSSLFTRLTSRYNWFLFIYA